MSDRSRIVKMAARRTGQLITLAALIFLAWTLYRQWDAISDWRPTAVQVALLVLLALLYGAALILLAFNWATIVQTLIAQPLPRGPLLLSYTHTQIAKYIPGNIVHFVGRHIYLNNMGVAHRPLATASMVEVASLPLAAAVAICLAVSFTGTTDITSPDIVALAPVVLFVTLGIVAAVIWRVPKAWRVATVIVLIRGTGFMLCQGIIFAIILAVISGNFIALAIPAAILAWLIGFLTPGAPGGIAVREALLISLLAVLAAGNDVLIAALLLRLVTTAGDLLLYVFGDFVLTRYAGCSAHRP